MPSRAGGSGSPGQCHLLLSQQPTLCLPCSPPPGRSSRRFPFPCLPVSFSLPFFMSAMDPRPPTLLLPLEWYHPCLPPHFPQGHQSVSCPVHCPAHRPVHLPTALLPRCWVGCAEEAVLTEHLLASPWCWSWSCDSSTYRMTPFMLKPLRHTKPHSVPPSCVLSTQLSTAGNGTTTPLHPGLTPWL